MIVRAIVFIVLCVFLWTAVAAYDLGAQPPVSAHVAIAALNGGDSEAAAVRAAHQINNEIPFAAAMATAIIAAACFWNPLKRGSTAAWKEFRNA